MKSTSIKISYTWLFLSQYPCNWAKKKKSNITNVLLLFVTETGEGKCGIINVALKR